MKIRLSALLANGIITKDANGNLRFKGNGISVRNGVATFGGATIVGDDGKPVVFDVVKEKRTATKPVAKRATVIVGRADEDMDDTAREDEAEETETYADDGEDTEAREETMGEEDDDAETERTIQRIAERTAEKVTRTIAKGKRTGAGSVIQRGLVQQPQMPASSRRYGGKLQVFKDTPDGARGDEICYQFAMSVLSACPASFPSLSIGARKWNRQNGLASIREVTQIMTRAGMSEASFQDGGFARRPDFIGPLFDTINIYGKYPQVARTTPMSSDTADASFPKIKDLVAAAGETQDIESDETNSEQFPVTLVARDWRGVVGISRDLSEDAIVPVFDIVAHDMMVSVARLIDYAGFSGDGTNAYNGFVGMRKALRDVDPTIGDIRGIVSATGTGWNNVTRQNMLELQGRAMTSPYVQMGDPAWACSPTFYSEVLVKLNAPPSMDGSGNIVNVVTNSSPDYKNPMFLGYPVIITNAMPLSTPATGVVQIPCLFGSWKHAANYGDRQTGSEIIVDESIMVLKNKVALIFKKRGAVANVNLQNTVYADGTILPGAISGLAVTGT